MFPSLFLKILQNVPSYRVTETQLLMHDKLLSISSFVFQWSNHKLSAEINAFSCVSCERLNSDFIVHNALHVFCVSAQCDKYFWRNKLCYLGGKQENEKDVIGNYDFESQSCFGFSYNTSLNSRVYLENFLLLFHCNLTKCKCLH